MSNFDSIYPDVTITPRFNFDGEIENIDVFIDNLHDDLHCEEFVRNDIPERLSDTRFKSQRRVAIKELTAGLYNEDGNPIDTARNKKS